MEFRNGLPAALICLLVGMTALILASVMDNSKKISVNLRMGKRISIQDRMQVLKHNIKHDSNIKRPRKFQMMVKTTVKPEITQFTIHFQTGSKNTAVQFEENDDCADVAAWDVQNVSNINIIAEINEKVRTPTPVTSYKQNKCLMTFQGSRTCTPVFGCTNPVNLEQKIQNRCKKEFLRVEDGLGGSASFCASDKVPLLQASHGGRDLFVTFYSAETTASSKLNAKKGFSCFVKCLKPSMSPKPVELQEGTETPKKRRITQGCSCGEKDQVGQTGRIIGGRDVKMNEFPFLVPIVKGGSRDLWCGGSIINSHFVLSAAHCFVNNNVELDGGFDVLVHARVLGLSFPQDGTVTKEAIKRVPGYELGEITDKDEKTARYTIVEKIFPPLYTSEEMDGDVVLLRLDRKIDFKVKDAPRPVCLPLHRRFDEKSGVDHQYEGLKTTVAGWGKFEEAGGVYSRLPQKLEHMPMLNYSTCKKLLNGDDITERMICAGFIEGGKDSCQGDSGSPLFRLESNGHYRQIGINSWGDSAGCALKNSPGVYTDLRPLMQWIYYQTSISNVSKDIDWCKDPSHHTTINATTKITTKIPTKLPLKVTTKHPVKNKTTPKTAPNKHNKPLVIINKG